MDEINQDRQEHGKSLFENDLPTPKDKEIAILTTDPECGLFHKGEHKLQFFADAKEKHAMRYTQYRGLAGVSSWVKLKYAAMNLKKLATWKWRDTHLLCIFEY